MSALIAPLIGICQEDIVNSAEPSECVIPKQKIILFGNLKLNILPK